MSCALSCLPGDLVEIGIHDLGSRGQGVGRTAGGLVVMVPGAVPGDRVSARVTRMLSNRAEASLEEVLEASPDRTSPRCRHFGVCGGCVLQNLTAAAQRRLKAGRLAELLRRTGGLSGVPVAPAVAVGSEYGYRGRMSFAAGPGGRIGLHDRDGRLLEISECHLPRPVVMAALERVRGAVVAAGQAADGLRRVDIRCSRIEDRALATLEWGGPGPVPAPLRTALAAAVAGAPWLRVEVAAAGRRPWSAGGPPLQERLAGVPVALAAGAFVQTHAAGAEALYEGALEWLRPLAAAGRPLLDLYAGTGVLSRAAIPPFPAAVAVEAAPAAVRLGQAGAATAGVPVRFRSGPAETEAAALAAAGERYPAAVVNPPRAGLHRLLPERLAALGVRRLAYISCQPATLARDLGRLAAAGLAPRQVIPHDLFPQTSEMEVLALLETAPAPGS